jgi:predicted RNA-binding protein with PUA-like domain
MRVVSDPRPDPEAGNEKLVAVEVEVVRQLPRAVTLDEIKNDKALKGWDLVRLPRLSIVPVTDAQWRRIETLAAKK